MEAFDEAVGLRVIRRRHLNFYPPVFCKLLKEIRAKLRSSVRGYGGWHTEVRDPAIRKGFDDALGGNIHKRNRYGPASKSVYGREEVFKPIGTGQCHQVNVQMLKTTIWHYKFAYGRGHVTRDLGLLTFQTLTSPSAAIFPHRGPNDFGSDCLSRPLDPWVAEAV